MSYCRILLILICAAAPACYTGHAERPLPPEPPDVLAGGEGDFYLAKGPREESAESNVRGPIAAELTTASQQVSLRKELSGPAGMGRGRGRVMAGQGSSEGESAATTPVNPSTVPGRQKLVVTGVVELSADDVKGTTATVRAEAVRRGATVVLDRENGARYGGSSQLQIRLPVDAVDPFVAWLTTTLASQASIESSNLTAADVTREYVDQDLQLRTLRFTLDRLEKILADRADVSLSEVLSVEREMTRVRGEIESLEGQHRYLADRAERATLDIRVKGRGQIDSGAPEQKFILMARGLALRFADDRFRHQNRLGGGVALMLGRRLDIGLDIYPARDLDDRSILLNVGAAFYSDFLGAGRRRFGNPFIGFRVGAGSFNNRSTLTYGAELGIELVRLKSLLVDLTGRASGFYYNRSPTGSDISFQASLAAGIPF